MKKILITALAAVALAVPNAPALQVTFQPGPYVSPTGGEFWATIAGGDTFVTMCLEINENVSFGHLYDATIDPYAIEGGLGGGPNDPISIGTAWLYLNVVLPRGYTGNPYNSDAHATSMQDAIWWLEDELSLVNPLANTWLLLAVNENQMGLNALKNNYTGDRVAALNPTYIDPTTGERVHSQSVLIPIPDGGFTLALLGMGLSGLAILRRKR